MDKNLWYLFVTLVAIIALVCSVMVFIVTRRQEQENEEEMEQEIDPASKAGEV